MEHFKKLSAINVNKHTEKKNKLTYLSWVWAWAEVKKIYPDAKYEVIKFDGLPYVHDENTGYMCYTTVTIEGLTNEMWLPVMDGANKAMKNKQYSYEVAEWKNYKKTGNMVTKYVEPATMFDINKTIMRCLTKNLAMFGLGLYIYAGEDLPDVETDKKPVVETKKEPIWLTKEQYDKAINADEAGVRATIKAFSTPEKAMKKEYCEALAQRLEILKRN